jgi:hypothetical protein
MKYWYITLSIALPLCFMFLLCLTTGGCSSSDTEIQYNTALDLEYSGNYQEAIDLLTKVAQSSKGKYLYYRAKADIARNYFFLNQLDKAGYTARTLLSTLPDTLNPKISLDVRMVLMSIERKTSLQEGGVK